MGMPTEPLLELMRRSMANLEFVETHASSGGPYEVTQLLNTFLGALAHPFEAMRDDLNGLPLTEAVERGWPAVSKEKPSDRDPRSLEDLIRLMRNGFAHGNIELISEGKGQIGFIRIWNNQPNTGVRTWGAVVRGDDMRRFLACFVKLIEERHAKDGWYSSRLA